MKDVFDSAVGKRKVKVTMSMYSHGSGRRTQKS